MTALHHPLASSFKCPVERLCFLTDEHIRYNQYLIRAATIIRMAMATGDEQALRDMRAAVKNEYFRMLPLNHELCSYLVNQDEECKYRLARPDWLIDPLH